MKEQGKGIDWNEVRTRLEESRLGLEKALAPGTEQAEAIFQERASQLANRQAKVAQANSGQRMLIFSLGAERYALDFADLLELIPYAHCTPVPGGPSQLLGVINFHGEIRSVVDLGRLLGLPEISQELSGYVLLVRKGGREFGLRVDRLDKIQLVVPEELATPGAVGGELATRYARNVTRDRIILLSTEAILTHPIFSRG